MIRKTLKKKPSLVKNKTGKRKNTKVIKRNRRKVHKTRKRKGGILTFSNKKGRPQLTGFIPNLVGAVNEFLYKHGAKVTRKAQGTYAKITQYGSQNIKNIKALVELLKAFIAHVDKATVNEYNTMTNKSYINFILEQFKKPDIYDIKIETEEDKQLYTEIITELEDIITELNKKREQILDLTPYKKNKYGQLINVMIYNIANLIRIIEKVKSEEPVERSLYTVPGKVEGEPEVEPEEEPVYTLPGKVEGEPEEEV